MDAPRLSVTLFQRWDAMGGLLDAWNAFVSQTEAWTLCATHEWLTSWWTAYAGSDELFGGESAKQPIGEPFVIAVHDDHGDLVGLAPFYRCREAVRPAGSLRVLRFLGTGTGGTSTSLSIVAQRGLEGAVIRRVLDALSDLRAQWDMLDLHLMPEEWHSVGVLVQELTVRGWLRSDLREHHGVVVFPATYEAYLASLSKRMRTELPYEHRRLLKAFGVELRRVETEADLQRGLTDLIRLNTQRWQDRGEAGSFAVEEKRVLAAEFARRFFARGWLDFWVLDLNGKPAAMEFAFRIDGVFYPLWVALDTDYRDYSPGAVLKALIIERLIADGVRVYEFMQGGEPYKARWGTQARKYVNVGAVRPYSRAALQLNAVALHARGRGYVSRRVARVKSALRMWLVPRQRTADIENA